MPVVFPQNDKIAPYLSIRDVLSQCYQYVAPNKRLEEAPNLLTLSDWTDLDMFGDEGIFFDKQAFLRSSSNTIVLKI